MEELTSENRRIDKQNSELHNAIKKQMQLINNLKRQKVISLLCVKVLKKETYFCCYL